MSAEELFPTREESGRSEGGITIRRYFFHILRSLLSTWSKRKSHGSQQQLRLVVRFRGGVDLHAEAGAPLQVEVLQVGVLRLDLCSEGAQFLRLAPPGAPPIGRGGPRTSKK